MPELLVRNIAKKECKLMFDSESCTSIQIKDKLTWKPKISLTEGIKKTINN